MTDFQRDSGQIGSQWNKDTTLNDERSKDVVSSSNSSGFERDTGIKAHNQECNSMWHHYDGHTSRSERRRLRKEAKEKGLDVDDYLSSDEEHEVEKEKGMVNKIGDKISGLYDQVTEKVKSMTDSKK